MSTGTRLAATLLYPRGRSMEGTSLLDCVASDDDRDLLISAIGQSAHRTDFSEMLQSFKGIIGGLINSDQQSI